MYRVAVSRLRALEHHARATRYASTSVAKRSSGGFFSWLTGEQSSQLPPLDFPLPGVMLPPPLPDHVEPGKTKITTLPNGVKIASETSPNPAVSLGLYVDCGSVYETPLSFGATHLLELMAFKSTTNRSHLRIVREVEAIGGNVMASASREQMGYTYDALKTYMPEMVEVLVDCVRNAAFLDWEVNEQLQKVKAEIGEISKNPQGLLLEAIHSAGYSGALANPLMATESSINRLNSTTLEEFVVENYTAPRMVLAASGVEHEELVSIAEPLLSDLPKVPRPEEPKSVYVGGDYRCQADSDKTHVALAFEVPGGWRQEKDAMTLTVIQMLMGGGDSFSAGGPGKGMYSRLYLRVLNEHQQIQSFSAFNSIYNNTGIFGIHATTSSDFVSKAIDLAIRELHAIATPGQVDQLQLDRAKESTKSAVLMNLESRMVASEDIGRQILTYGERTASGTFTDGDLRLNQRGLRLISEETQSSRPPDSEDLEFSREDLEVIKVIGKGSGGIVQLVRHKWHGTFYALKGIQMCIQETVRKQIVQELKINKASQCSHVVVCYHSFYHNGVISLVLEYMDRGSLADIIKQVKTILEPYLAVVCMQVLKGLVYLHHERHVIHRDIKPSNLLVNHKGEVKITDFGVSAVLASSMGQRDTFVGTYNYMAPERISGSSYDYKSDIWSLGLVILECAIGHFPYTSTEQEESLSFYELLEAIVDQPPPFAPPDQFSPEFCSFISASIQKDPKQRLSSLELLSHPFIKKFEDKDIDLAILVGSLDPPVNLSE